MNGRLYNKPIFQINKLGKMNKVQMTINILSNSLNL
jgi:hypothetical protein